MKVKVKRSLNNLFQSDITSSVILSAPQVTREGRSLQTGELDNLRNDKKFRDLMLLNIIKQITLTECVVESLLMSV